MLSNRTFLTLLIPILFSWFSPLNATPKTTGGDRLPITGSDLFSFAMEWMQQDHEAPQLIDLLLGIVPTPTSTPTSTPIPTETSTGTPVQEATPTSTLAFDTPTPTWTASPTFSPSPTRTATITPDPTGTPSASPTEEPGPTFSFEETFVNYETPPVHPLDLSPDGGLLAAANLADYRVEFFAVAEGGVLTPTGSVPVGVDPVTVRFRTSTELWVVNHISDSISLIDIPTRRVKQTLITGDEPCDVVFAGSPQKAFVTCSQINEIWIFDPSDLEAAPVRVPVDGEDPRSLDVSPDGSQVYAAVFESGNGSTLLGGGADDLDVISFPPNVASDPSGPYGGQNPPPNSGNQFTPAIAPGTAPPKVGLIVKKNSQGLWLDDNGGDWTDFVTGPNAPASGRVPGWDLPDRDVAVVDVESATVVSYVTGLMNICMSLAVYPVDGTIHVVGTDGINEVRFEPVINGRFLRVLCSRSDPSGATASLKQDLNTHLLPYDASRVAQASREMSLGDPRGLVWLSDGSKGFVSGMGSNNLAVIDSDGNRIGQTPTIEVGEGPTGLALDEAKGYLYVLNRFEASVSIVSITAEVETSRVPFFDPTPEVVRRGRRHLYSTHDHSGLGYVNCGACHVDSRMDRLAWDLGDPSGAIKALNSGGSVHNLGAGLQNLIGGFEDFEPMKGPMTTQTLQDIIGHEPLHWRGDRDGIEEFNGAYVSLQAADQQLSPDQMQDFEDFLDTITFPPNPFRNFDNTLPTDLPLPGHYTTGRFGAAGQPLLNGNAQRGLGLYRDLLFRPLDNPFACVTCHTLPTGMGTDMVVRQPLTLPPSFDPIPLGPKGETHHALVSVDGSTNKTLKVPQLRNQYEKTGFNMVVPESRAGFGLLHDGSVDSIERFVSEEAFDVNNDQEVADLTALVLAFSGSDFGIPGLLDPPGPPSQDSHAAVGAQLTLAAPGIPSRLIQLVAVAETGRADLIVKGRIAGDMRGALYDPDADVFTTDRDAEGPYSLSEVSGFAASGSELTFTLVPPSTGIRAGIDRDLDGYGDQTERESGGDPDDPGVHP